MNPINSTTDQTKNRFSLTNITIIFSFLALLSSPFFSIVVFAMLQTIFPDWHWHDGEIGAIVDTIIFGVLFAIIWIVTMIALARKFYKWSDSSLLLLFIIIIFVIILGLLSSFVL